MITTTQMYWLVKLDDIRCVFGDTLWFPIAWIIVVAIVSFAAFLGTIDEMEDKRRKVHAILKKALWTCVPMLFLIVIIQVTVALVPSTRQMAAIVVLPKIVNNEKVQTMGNRLYDLALEWMEEMRPANRAERPAGEPTDKKGACK